MSATSQEPKMFGSNVQPKRRVKALRHDWLCNTCGFHNRFGQNKCLDCGKEAPNG